jgi:2-polyprenyl-6-methoxyphenol hydroxylase-like FAD-dependent oxidoreductase
LAYSEIHHVLLDVAGQGVTVVDFGRLRRQPHPYIAMVPQWDLLNLLAESAQTEPTFTLRMQTEVTGLLHENGRVVGVRYQGPDGPGEIRAELTVACDGRWSIARHEAGLRSREFPVNFDVWWFRLPNDGPAQPTLLPRLGPGRAAIMIPRRGYFQVAYLGSKDEAAALRARGIDAFRRDVVELIPEADVSTLRSMDDVKHLDVKLNRLRGHWHVDGLLCIGDAAHAMSPVGGVGINLAVQDAVAAATVLAEPLRQGHVTSRDLAAVHRRRILPTVVTQTVQRVLHRGLAPILRGKNLSPPAAFGAVMAKLPWLSAIPAYLVGVGVRPERAPSFARR